MTDDPVHIAARAFGLWETYRAECWITAELDSDWRHAQTVQFEAFDDAAAIEWVKRNRTSFFFSAAALFDHDEDAPIPELKVEIFGMDPDTGPSQTREAGEVYFHPEPDPER